MSTVYTVLDNRDKNELNVNLQNAKTELQGNIDSLTSKHDEDKNELQQQINTLVSEKATKAELSAHNTSNSAHNDIRLLIQGLTDRLNALADSDDETLDQMSEIVAYIEDNRDLIESITTSKVNVSDIINNLTTNVANKPLSASMGVELKRLIDNIPNDTLDIVNEKIIAHNIAGDAHEDIRTDILNIQGYANTAKKTAENAKQLASSAQSDATDALQRVSSLEVGSGKIDRIVSASDGFAVCEDILQDSKPIDMVFYGNTAQNLWANPSGTSNGVTATSNADGSLSVSGTADASATNGVVIKRLRLYVLKPSTQYTISCDKPIAFDTRYGFVVDEYASDGSIIVGHYLSSDNATTKVTFTTSENMVYVDFGISVDVNATASGTFRVMLNEGSEALPWCPPGINIIDDISICVGETYDAANITIPVDLAENTCCSLPNGMRDELHVDVNGDVTILKQCGYIQSYNNEEIGDIYIATKLTADGKPAVGSQVVYQLGSSNVVTLTSIDLPTFVSATSYVWAEASVAIDDLNVRYWLTNGELVSDLYASGATEELTDDEIIAIWDGATGDIVEATNADIKAIFYEE